jgi:hypothetical protein
MITWSNSYINCIMCDTIIKCIIMYHIIYLSDQFLLHKLDNTLSLSSFCLYYNQKSALLELLHRLSQLCQQSFCVCVCGEKQEI